jgi:hypothetical protein
LTTETDHFLKEKRTAQKLRIKKTDSSLHVNADGKVPEGVGPVEGLEVVEGAGVVVQQVTQEGGSTPPGGS